MGYSSILKFTVDGRPSVQDIHALFSTLISQVAFSTHRHRFRSYGNTFASQDAIRELGTLTFTKSFELSETTTTSSITTMSPDMAKALIQQFIWTRLITNAADPLNKTYRDKGLWRLSSKGLCVLQEFCAKNKRDIDKFVSYVDPSARLSFLIQIERLPENDRLNCKRKYTACLFAIMIASLPLPYNADKESKTTFEDDMCLSDIAASRSVSFSDHFPHIKILPNDLLVELSNQKSSFQQQRALLQNLNPSSTSKKFKMRAIFTSIICCNWLTEFCTVASNDEAESIMTEFLNLGWIAFYDDKHRHAKYIESSESITLNMTREGIEAVMEVSLKQCHDIQQQAVEDQSSLLNNRPLKDKKARPTLQLDRRESKIPPLLQTSTCSSNSGTMYDNSTTSYFDIKKLNQSNYRSYATNTPPLTPTTPTTSTTSTAPPTNYYCTNESNSAKLGMVLKDAYLQSLFRDFLVSTCCAENLDFWVDHANLRRNCRRYNQQQVLEDAYALWEAYLQPGTTLGIDPTLLQDMAEEITNMVTMTPGQPTRPMMLITSHPVQNLTTILNWLDKVNDQISQLMAFDSIPRFIRTFEYKKAVYKLQSSSEDLDDFPPPPQRKLKETL